MNTPSPAKSPRIFLTGIAAIAGLALGLITGHDRPGNTPAAASPASASGSRAARTSAEDTATAQRHTFGGLLRRVKLYGPIPKEAADFLASASRDEIFREMEALATARREPLGFFQKQRLTRMLMAAAREIYRREGLAGTEWAEANGSMDVAGAMVDELCRQDPAHAAAHWKIFLDRFRSAGIWQGPARVVEGAASRGSRELLAVDGTSDRAVEFGEDFDFKDYLSKTKSANNLEAAFSQWAATDPDAVARALHDGTGLQAGQDGPHDARFAAAFKGRAAMAGEDTAAAWISGQLAALPADQRQSLIQPLAAREPSPSRVRALIANLPAEKDRIDFAVAVTGSFGADHSGSRQAIGESSPEAFRIQVATQWLATRKNLLSGDSAFVESVMTDLKIPEAVRAELLRSNR